MAGPIEVKVKASTTAGTVATAISGIGLWALETHVFHGEVPEAVRLGLPVLVVAISTFLAGYLAPHTPRPDTQITQADVADALVRDDEPGDHALDGDPGEIPASKFLRRD